MDLLSFYIHQIFSFSHLPLPSEVCSQAASIKPMCMSTLSFTLLFVPAVILVTVIVALKKLTNNYTLIIFSILRVLACFYLADHAMKQIQEPARYGVEWFTILYHLWCFIIFNAFLTLILLPKKTRLLLFFTLGITIMFIPILAYFGRGFFEQITPLAGGLFAEISWKMLLLYFSFKFFLAIAIIGLISAFVAFISFWTVNGAFKPVYFRRNIVLIMIFLCIIIMPVASVPLGEVFNKEDVREAKSYIDNLKKKVDKYYFENGEYPKFIEKMLPDKADPLLLDRQEFFTSGIRGTYYFSRKEKYCFLFQNPTRNFGYYSLTSERGWRYTENSGSYDEVFVNLCDESNKNFQDLISNHLDANDEDKIINAISADTGNKIVPAMSKKSSQIIEERIREDSKKDPSLLKYFKEDKK